MIKPNTTVCDIDIPEQFCFGMEVEEAGTVVSILKGEDENCVGGDVICIIDDELVEEADEKEGADEGNK